MHLRSISAPLGLLVALLAVFMLPSLGWSLHHGEGLWPVWLKALALLGLIAAVLIGIGYRQVGDILQREALAIVGLGWVLAAALGALPFVLSGAIPSYTDAFFETMSGFTTTGSTILDDIEAVPASLLFWRSMTHWLGGIGIIVLFVAIMPLFAGTVASRRLYASELPGVSAEGLTPRIKQTALLLLKLYLGLSAVQATLYLLGGMSLFDALCHTFGTMATGGFSTRADSIGAYNSLYLEGVTIAFMFLAGTNFTLHHRFMGGRLLAHVRDAEFRHYVLTLAGAIVLLMLILMAYQPGADPLRQLREVSFTAVSIMTTTGYGTVDFDPWPQAARLLLVLIMFIGGCGGSTGGGMKVIRFVVLFRHLFAQVERYHSPRTVRPIKIGGQAISETVVFMVLGYCFTVALVTGVATLCVALLEPQLDLTSSFTAVAATLNNIGPGLGAVGAVESFSFLHAPTKWLLSLMMVLGRLEFFPVLVLLAPRFWYKD